MAMAECELSDFLTVRILPIRFSVFVIEWSVSGYEISKNKLKFIAIRFVLSLIKILSRILYLTFCTLACHVSYLFIKPSLLTSLLRKHHLKTYTQAITKQKSFLNF